MNYAALVFEGGIFLCFDFAMIRKLLLPLLIFLFQIQAFAQSGNKLPVFDQNYLNAPLTVVLENIQKNSDTRFFYQKEWGIEAFLINGKQGENAIPIILDALQAQDFGIVEYQGLYILVNQKGLDSYHYEQWEENDPNLNKYRLIGEGKPENAGEPVVIAGQIRDTNEKEPLIGASIQVAESSQGVVTDIDGNYELSLKPGKYVLLVQYAGYESQSVPVQIMNSGNLDVELFNNTLRLEEVTISARSQDVAVSEKIAGQVGS